MSDTHYFPPGRSMARRVHGERSVGLLYGQRAQPIGALEPLTYTGTILSTSSGDRPFARLARTAKIFGIRRTPAHGAAFRSVAATHRRTRHAMPHALRRGRNDRFFEVAAAAGRRGGGTPAPRLDANAA